MLTCPKLCPPEDWSKLNVLIANDRPAMELQWIMETMIEERRASRAADSWQRSILCCVSVFSVFICLRVLHFRVKGNHFHVAVAVGRISDRRKENWTRDELTKKTSVVQLYALRNKAVAGLVSEFIEPAIQDTEQRTQRCVICVSSQRL